MTLLETALNQIAQGPAAVRAWLDQNPEALQPEFLESVKQYALGAMQHGAPNTALAAYILAGVVHMKNGDLEGVMTSQLNQAEVMFFTAETTEAYEQAHAIAGGVADQALKRDLTDTAFWALGLAADAAFFGSEAAGGDALLRQWLSVAIDTLLRLEPLTPGAEASGSWLRFVSGLVAIYQRTIQADWGPEAAAVEVKLCRLAALSERLIPFNFTFDEPEKTAHVAHNLAELSKRCGNAAAAEARLKAIYQTSKSDKWSDN